MKDINVTIVGGSGYVGGELIRLMLFHPFVKITQVTSQKFDKRSVAKAHPNLRKVADLKYSKISDLQNTDYLFLCLPHGKSMSRIQDFAELSRNIIDLSSDFRLHNPKEYEKWYGIKHAAPELLSQFVYGLPELHRTKIKSSRFVSSAGCNATATILGLYPFYKHDLIDPERTVVEVKVGSSEGGNNITSASHHPERAGSVRSYKPTEHRHIAEIKQELNLHGNLSNFHFSATTIDMVRGAIATSHIFLKEDLSETEIWKLYRQEYSNEPFLRIIKERDGIYRFPEPKLLIGSNYCDIGFQKDPQSNRIVVISALDNLMKGAAGQAIQAFNLMNGFDEKLGLEFPGLHPI